MEICLKQKGFLLVEVVVAMLILAVGILSVSGMLLQSVKANANAAEESAAVRLAQQRMERLRGQPKEFWILNCPSSNISFPDESSSMQQNNVTYSIFSISEDFHITGNSGNVVLAKVTVRVEWQTKDSNGLSKIKQVQLVSLLSKTS